MHMGISDQTDGVSAALESILCQHRAESRPREAEGSREWGAIRGCCRRSSGGLDKGGEETNPLRNITKCRGLRALH